MAQKFRFRQSSMRKRLQLEWLEERCTPSDGGLDVNFGSGGSITTNFTARFVGSDLGQDVLVQPDGRILVVGYTSANGTNDFALARYLSDGQLDTTFGNGGKVITDFAGNSDVALDAVLQADGSVVVAGYAYTGAATGFDFAIARYTSTGQLDVTFGIGGKVTTAFAAGGTDQATGILLQADGKIVATGFCTAGAATGTDFAAVRYLADGQLDSSFGTAGKAVIAFTNASTDQANGSALQSDGGIVLGGVRNLNGNYDFALARLTMDGVLDQSFGSGGKVTAGLTNTSHDVAEAVAIQADGKIVAAGFSSGPGTYDFSVMRFTTGGLLDATFDGDGKVATDFSGGSADTGQALTLQADGKLVVAGFTSFQTAPNNLALARFDANGQLDTSFSDDGKVITSVVSGNDQALALALQNDGNIVVAGYAALPGNGNDFAVARFIGSSNAPPTANAGGPYDVGEGGFVALSGLGSSDPNQPANTLEYAWDLDDDGIFGESGADASHGDELGATTVFSAAAVDGPTNATVWLRVTDSGGLSSTISTTVQIANATPTADAGLDVNVSEGDFVTLTGSFSDPGVADTHTLAWKVVDADGNVVIEARGASVDFTALDNGIYVATFTVTDDDGAAAADSTTITVLNQAPTATLSGPQQGVNGQPLTFQLAARDPGSTDDVAPFTYLVDWGDGSPATTMIGSGAGVPIVHAFLQTGSFVVKLTAIDKDGAASATATLQVQIDHVVLQDDPLNPGRTMLLVGGTERNDHIVVIGRGRRHDIRVRLNGRTVGEFAPTSRVIVYSNGGNDCVMAVGHLEVPVWLFGGAGNDRLYGGSGPSLLFGETGTDVLRGGAGRSVLIGGAGADVLQGGGGADILVSDDLNATEQEWLAALDAWNSSRNNSVRTQALADMEVVSRLTNDLASDRLIGVTKRDWLVGVR